MSAAALPVFVTVDIGPALATLPGPRTAWDATWAGVPAVRTAFRDLAARLGREVPVTWFVRADAAIAAASGDPLHAWRAFARILAEDGGAEGDETGWMPLLPADADGTRDVASLAAVHAALAAEGPAPASARMGNLSHDDATLAAFDALGIAVDCTAVPGRRKHEAGWAVDWAPTPAAPYRPAVADYRVAGTPARRLLELPITPLPIRAPYDPAPRLRYVNPGFRPELLWQALGPILAGAPYLVLLLHPDELVPQADGHPLVAYSPAVVAGNLARIVDAVRAAGREPAFHRVRDAARVLPGVAP